MTVPDIMVPFREEEMLYEDKYPGMEPDAPGTPVLKTPIQPHENLKMLFAGEKPLWMPSFLEFKMFNPRILAENAVRPGAPKVPDITEWEKYIVFPDLSKLDWAGSLAENAEYLNDPRAIQMTVFTGFFERLVSFVDMTQARSALVDEEKKPAVHRLFQALADFYDELFYYLSKWYRPDLLLFQDDWGSQSGPLFSLEICREMIVPYLKQTVESAHNYGIGFEFHCCGKVEQLVPAMIEAGVDMWAGQDMNDKEQLYRQYGQNIILGVDPPKLPLDASPEQVAERTAQFLDMYPRNVYVGMSFAADSRYYTEIYRQSRIRYNS